MKYMLRLMVGLLLPAFVYSQDKPEYAIRLIPDSIRAQSPVIMRQQFEKMTVTKPGKGNSVIRRVFSVLDKKGKEALVFSEYTDKFRRIDEVSLNLYDENGKFLRRLKKKDLVRINDEFDTFLSDDKILIGGFTDVRYPVTVEVIYEVSFEGFLEYPDFFIARPDMYIQAAEFILRTQKNNPPRYKNYRCAVNPVVKEETDLISYAWNVKDVAPLMYEEGAPGRSWPRVMISPTLFEMDGYLGDMSSWKGLGQWSASLIQQTNRLPDASVPFYQNLVKDAPDEREKARILYRYLQENCRYLSIQLGIGGWKPFPAEFTEKKKYGDCKGLTNYMQAMLQAVGVRSHYAIINAGYDQLPVDDDFSQDRFNHIILCVPLKNDTIWLECTSKTQPFGVLGNFTENRKALLVTEQGGVLVRTPSSRYTDNQLVYSSLVRLQQDGSAEVLTEIKHTGEFSQFLNTWKQADESGRNNFLVHRQGFKQPDNWAFKNPGADGGVPVQLQMSFRRVADFSAGSKQFIGSRLHKLWIHQLPRTDKREMDYYLEFPFIQTDTTRFVIPSGYTVDVIPRSVDMKTSIGEFQTQYHFDSTSREFITICRMVVYRHIIPAASYQEAYGFFNTVVKELQQKWVMKRDG